MKISPELMLRLLNIQEFFASQWLATSPFDQNKLAELSHIQKTKQSLLDLAKKDEDEGDASGSGGSTAKGLRAKDDPKRNPFSKKMTRR